ncbi:MAG: hypothetical protein ABWJ98_02735 [Hydrogenothermaceae bacterium]
MRLTVESKIKDIFDRYPKVKEIVDPYLEYFYKERLEDILFKRLSLSGILKIINISQEERENLIQEINKILNKS